MFLREINMRSITKACLLSLMLVLALSIATQESFGAGQIGDVPAAFIDSYMRGDFAAASELFHIPASYTQEQASQEKESAVKVLELFHKEFGQVTSSRMPSEPYRYYNVMFGTGDLNYWNKYPSFTQVPYEVEFSKLGKGYVLIALVNINKKTEIRQISFALPVESPGAKKSVTAIMNKMMSMLQHGG